MLTTYGRTQTLNWRSGVSAPATVTTRYLALFTAVGTVAGTGFAEASYTGYARVAVTFGAASGTDPDTIANTAAVTFGTCTASPGSNIIAWGVYDASSGGNLLEFDYIVAGGTGSSGVWMPFTASAASPSVITTPAHGFTAGQFVVVTSEYGGTLPTLSAGSFTGVLTVAATVTTDSFTLTTSGATALNASSTGDGMLRQVAPQAMVVNVTPSFPVGYFVLAAA